MIRGKLSEMQRDAAWDGKSLTERERMTAHNLSTGGEDNARDAGLIATATGAARGLADGSERRRDQERRRQLSEAAMRAAERIGEIDRQLAGLYEERERILEGMRETQERINTLRDGIRQVAENGDLERDENGALENRALEAQIRAYERRTGRPVDRNDPETLLLVLNEQLEHEGGEMDQHRERERENESEIDRLERERETHVETIRRENPEADIDALVASFAERGDVVSDRARILEGVPEEVVGAAVQHRTAQYEARSDEDFDLFGAPDDAIEHYEPFADEIDPEGAAQVEQPADSPQQDRTQPESQPDPITPRFGG